MTIHVPIGFMNVTYRFSLTGDLEPMTVAMGVSIDTLLDVTEVADEAFAAATESGMPFAAASMLAGWQFLGTTAALSDGAGSIIAEHNEVVFGTIAAAALPNNCTHLVQKRTANGGRSQRGRMYPPAFHVGESSISQNGGFIETYPTIQALYTDWLARLYVGGLDPVLFHSAIDQTPTPITTLVLDTRIATQRRRLR